jgi:hypothetical protein
MNGGIAFEAYDKPDCGKNDRISGSSMRVKAIFYTYQSVSKVKQFNKIPYGERLKSASDSGMIF